VLDDQLRTLRHFKLSSAELDDVRSVLLGELYVALPGGRPRLERYSGVGALGGWLKVVATREALRWLRGHNREVSASDDTLLGELEAPAEAPELASLKSKYSGQLSAAFKRAIGGLEARQRNLLRQHYLDELSLDDLGALYRVHRATAARWLADAKTALLERTRNDISETVGLQRFEIDSVMRLVQSRLDLSAGVFLAQK